MKLYNFKNNEILIPESRYCTDEIFEVCHQLSNDILFYKNISNKQLFEIIDVGNGKIKTTPHAIRTLLLKEILPGFQFLFCKN